MIALFIISILSPAAALVLGYQQKFTLLWLYAATGLAFDVIGTCLKYSGHDNKWWSNLFILFEFLFISEYFRRKLFIKLKWISLFTLAVSAAFITTTISRSIYDFNTWGYSALCFIYMAYGIVGYYSMTQKNEGRFITDSPFFWSNTAVFLYSSSLILLFLFRYYLQHEDQQLFDTLWSTLFMVINIQRYLLLGVAMRKT